MKSFNFSLQILILFIVFKNIVGLHVCEKPFEGFGVFLGSAGHFGNSPKGMVQKVFEKVYTDLGIRYYRTSIESYFSPAPNTYEIACTNNFTCSWIEIHKEISKPMYKNISLMASIWSPPHYMKDEEFDRLKVEQEKAYHYFIKNITELIKTQFNLTIERVSPINEPENVFATWEHTNMIPGQLCRMVQEFNDPLISVCPENSYYWISEMYANFSNSSKELPKPPELDEIKCASSCEIFGTHAYALNINFSSPDNFKAYYDLEAYDRMIDKPIWMTEVSSTFGHADENEMGEALDLAMNIVNFVGHTCIQRYYYWYSYTLWSSGESLIWGNQNGELTFPKKYYTYKHFSLASSPGPTNVTKWNPADIAEVSVIKFGEVGRVFVNGLDQTIEIDWETSDKCQNDTFCCTSESADWDCLNNKLPPLSVCSCKIFKQPSSKGNSSVGAGINLIIVLSQIFPVLFMIIFG